ncbi:hypothetical protein BLNAU_17620 [Blattamonas nauphoetae]|uniref:OTU domain-containing protein n=1 Tax=Blattamonas nauphoetae TaxID=2049346 RepID=A0ABQ9XB64_9EUKA|nr:hypothetical protein BLNAU_17620 [Blattamonas nauphoetae]
MPLIALTMTLGVNEVKTAREGEPSFIFVNRNPVKLEIQEKTHNKLPVPYDYDEKSLQREKLNPIGQATITINRGDDAVVHIERDTFCYKYDVFMCPPTSENEVYDPDTIKKSSEPIGQLTMPSIHHFPHFFKLFVNHKNQVENRLRGTTWHIVDDYILQSKTIPDCEHVVLLTSPSKERWENIIPNEGRDAPVFMYNVPTLLFPEMIHMFNAIPCPYEYSTDEYSLMMRSQLSIHNKGLILRHLRDPTTVIRGNRVQKKSPPNHTRVRGEHFGPKTPHRYIQSSSPQFDPMNFYTQHATQGSFELVQERTTRMINESTNRAVDLRANKQMSSKEFAIKHEDDYQKAVEEGLVLKNLRPVGPLTFVPSYVVFPKTIDSLPQTMETSSDFESIAIPSLETLIRDDAPGYHPQWDFLFQCCLDIEALPSLKLTLEMDDPFDTDEDFVTGESPLDWTQAQVVTSHLIPDIETNAGFDSILLMSRFEKDSPDLHSLGVFFLQGTSGRQHGISDEGVVLMKRWCYVLAKEYRLKRVQLFPAFIVIKDPLREDEFRLKDKTQLESFIPVHNIWIAQYEAKGEVDVGTITLPAMTASATPVLDRFINDLPVNRNPHAVRCAFCGSLVVKNFPNHFCDEMKVRDSSIDINHELIDDLERSNRPKFYTTKVHRHVEKIQPKQKKGSQVIKPKAKSKVMKSAPLAPEKDLTLKEVTMSINLVSYASDIQHKNVNSEMQPTEQSSFRQEDYVQVTCTSKIPDMPDVYRLPSCQHSIQNGILSTRNQFQSEDAQDKQANHIHRDTSTQPLARSLLDPSGIIEALHLWAQGYKLSYKEGDKYQYVPIKLAEQPYLSLEFDLPSVDIKDPKHQRQFMLPAGANGRRDRVSVRLEEETDPLRLKRIEYESFWQSLNRKEPLIGMDVTLQADENKQIEMIHTSGNETKKSQLKCILSKGFLLRSRLSLQNGDVQAAVLFFVRSKQLVELNDTAAVECELIHALGRDSETNSHVFDELEGVAVNARHYFGTTWEQWNQERRSLPPLLTLSFHRLQFRLKRVQAYVTLLRWYLGMLGGVHIVDMQQTNGSRRTMMRNTLLQVLKEGLNLQLQIAWGAGDEDEVHSLLRELTYINRMEGKVQDTSMTLPLKTQTKQIEELGIDVVTEAIKNVLNTAYGYYEDWRAVVLEHRQTDSSEPRSSKNHERTVSRNEMRMSVQLLVDWISAIVEVFPQKLQETGNDHMSNDLFVMISELSSLEIAASNLDANVVVISKPKEEMGLFERANPTFDEKDFKKQWRTDKTDSGPFNPPSKPEKRASIDRSLPMTLSSSLDFSNRTTIDLQTFRERFGQQFVDDVEGDGNCWLYAVLEQLTDEDLARAGIEIPINLSKAERRRFFVDHIRPRLVEDMRQHIDEIKPFYHDPNVTLEQYIERQRTDGEWGGFYEFRSLSRIFERPIAYYYPNVVQPQVYERSGRRINIGFCGVTHFVSLRDVSRDKLRQKEMEKRAMEQAEEEEQLRRLVIETERRQNREEEERRKDPKRRK